MSERKVLNKYFPPDFDPSKVPRMRKSKDRQEQIRLMAPFSMRCNSCGEYIYAGKKFNGRKETVQGEVYYGIKIFRFYIKCPVCSSEITFKTDPKNADYTVEHGVSRNFEPWREGRKGDDDGSNGKSDPLAHMIEEEGLGEESDDEDPMKALEKRQEEAKREMEIMDALQDIRTRNARIDRVDADAVLQRRAEKGKEKLSEQQRADEEEDEALVRMYFGKDLADSHGAKGTKRTSSDDEEEEENEGQSLTQKQVVSIKRARPVERYDVDKKKIEEEREREPDVLSLLSEKARESISTPTLTPNAAASAKALPNSASAAKRKKGTSAFGIVRKRA